MKKNAPGSSPSPPDWKVEAQGIIAQNFIDSVFPKVTELLGSADMGIVANAIGARHLITALIFCLFPSIERNEKETILYDVDRMRTIIKKTGDILKYLKRYMDALENNNYPLVFDGFAWIMGPGKIFEYADLCEILISFSKDLDHKAAISDAFSRKKWGKAYLGRLITIPTHPGGGPRIDEQAWWLAKTLETYFRDLIGKPFHQGIAILCNAALTGDRFPERGKFTQASVRQILHRMKTMSAYASPPPYIPPFVT